MQDISLYTVVSIAFFASFGHCVGMCGGFVISYTSLKINPNDSKISQSISHLFYNLGRILTYTLIGALCGFFGSILALSPISFGYVYFFLGLIMVLMGFSLLGKISFLNSLEFQITKYSFIKKAFLTLLKSKSKFSFFALGMLNALVPCGLVYYFAAFAVSAKSALNGALIMLFFGASTFIALFSFGFMVSFLKNTIFREFMIKIAALAIILYGIYMSFLGFLSIREI